MFQRLLSAPRVLFCFAILTLSLVAQTPDASLRVTGALIKPITLSASDLAAMPRATVVLSGAIETRYEGVWMHEILRKAGVPLGLNLAGEALTTYVLAEARDGYEVVFSLGELDPAFADNQILIADKLNGKPLSGDEGPLRIIVPREKRAARSVRMLTRLDVVQLRK